MDHSHTHFSPNRYAARNSTRTIPTMTVMSAADLQAFLAREFPEVGALDLRVEHVDEQRIRLRLPAHESTLRPGGTISGPTMFTLADVAIYLLVLAQIGPVALAVTTSVGMNFLRKPPPGDLVAEGELLKLGSRLAVGHVRIHAEGSAKGGADDSAADSADGDHDSEELVADASLTYSIPPR